MQCDLDPQIGWEQIEQVIQFFLVVGIALSVHKVILDMFMKTLREFDVFHRLTRNFNLLLVFKSSPTHGGKDHCYRTHDMGMNELSHQESYREDHCLDFSNWHHLFSKEDVYRVIQWETVLVEHRFMIAVEYFVV